MTSGKVKLPTQTSFSTLRANVAATLTRVNHSEIKVPKLGSILYVLFRLKVMYSGVYILQNIPPPRGER